MSEKPHLTVIIPAYNEEPNVKRGALNEVPKYLEKQNYSYEILIVDDGSDDDTAKLSEAFAKKHKTVKIGFI